MADSNGGEELAIAGGAASWGSRQEDDDGWRKGPWTSQEDKLLVEHVRRHGDGRWNSVSKLTGLKRSGKSCRLRWVNYLRPDLKRGKITPQEETIIVQLHALWGNRWSTIARSLPGRTDNEIKNYWRTHFKKGKPSKNIERARARFLKQRREMQQQQQQKLQLLGKGKDGTEHGDARTAASVAALLDDDTGGGGDVGAGGKTLAATGREEMDQIMRDVMDDFFLWPMSCVDLFNNGLAAQSAGGGGGSCCDSTTEEYYGSSEDDGATWGSLWNLEDVVVDGVACTLW